MTLSSYMLGIVFLVVVSVLWTVCSMVVQHLYQDMEFDSPFLIVYIGTSLFSVFLPTRLVYERGRCCGRGCGLGDGAGVVVIPWKHDACDVAATAVTTDDAAVTGLVSPDRLVRDENGSCANMQGSGSQASPHYNEVSFSDDCCEPVTPPCTNRSSHGDESQDTGGQSGSGVPFLLSHRDHIAMASRVAPLWFLSNYFYALSLKWTTIASSTVLASMGSLFAFLFATCSRFGHERATWGKIVGVALCFLGAAATTWADAGGDGRGEAAEGARSHAGIGGGGGRHAWPHVSDLDDGDPMLALLGDLAGFLSAVGYGAYTVLIRHLCPQNEDRMSMQLMLGYIGLWNMVLLLPIAVRAVSAASSTERNYGLGDSSSEQKSQSPPDDDASAAVDTTLTWSIFLFLVLKGLLDNVLSDYLWARAVVLTSATVASVGVGLTIPMAFAADWLMGNADDVHVGEVWGALLVLLSFVFVNLDVFGETRAEDDGITSNGHCSQEGGHLT